MTRLSSLLLALAALFLLSPFAWGQEIISQTAPGQETITLERGRVAPVLDKVGWVLGLPNKLLLWDRRADNHEISAETEQRVVEYLAENDLEGVKVRVNQYDPLGEWRRLRENDRIGAGWRYTVGSLYTLGYTLLPGRLLGGDSYNPYTDTVNIYSDIPAIAVEQAAYAKDVHSRERPGGYAALQSLPLVALTHENQTKQDVFEHFDQHGDPAERAEARRVLYPQLGVEVGGQIGTLVPQGMALMQLAGAAVGHVAGQKEAERVSQSAVAEGHTAKPSVPVAAHPAGAWNGY
ncbi:hypothetical protein Mal64_16220 [Pseudobythopirellula maris]|uniref:Uncharacterized protein n=1 Tax=Pseudobythopirellula maris TaxID=2527991 RepID=A0A5C5ZLU6_9BACT|nr:hypothetical protein [Pseudobythopirellula maris]TWT88145.1 hypothetical protein Mal64_16220 [Pseudobythopirellula maris]